MINLYPSLTSGHVVVWRCDQVGVSMLLTMALNVFNPHIIPYLSIGYYKWRRKNKTCLRWHSNSQQELNRFFSGPDFELASRYGIVWPGSI